MICMYCDAWVEAWAMAAHEADHRRQLAESRPPENEQDAYGTAGPMLLRCFRHQHPEFYDRPEIRPEFPVETMTRAEPVPDYQQDVVMDYHAPFGGGE